MAVGSHLTTSKGVGEFSIAPDIVQSSSFETLLAGVTCKKLYGCSLSFDDKQGGWGIQQYARGDASQFARMLASRFIEQADTVINGPT